MLARFGLSAREVTDLIETAMHGRVVSRWYQGQRFFEILVRMDDHYRTHLESLERLPVETPGGCHGCCSAICCGSSGAVPIAFVGVVFALAITGQALSIAATVGFVSLGGIATRLFGRDRHAERPAVDFDLPRPR